MTADMDHRWEGHDTSPVRPVQSDAAATNRSNGTGKNGRTAERHERLVGPVPGFHPDRPCPSPTPARAATAATGVLIATHNDGANIATLLERLLAEPGVGELVVIASGCDDDTVPIVSEVAAGDPRVALYVEAERSGKASAVNFGVTCMSLPSSCSCRATCCPSPVPSASSSKPSDAPASVWRGAARCR